MLMLGATMDRLYRQAAPCVDRIQALARALQEVRAAVAPACPPARLRR